MFRSEKKVDFSTLEKKDGCISVILLCLYIYICKRV